MISIEAGIVDVFVLRQRANQLEVLALQRGTRTRCPGSWEIVHGSIERDEPAPAAARREVREETGLDAERLYSITANPFFLNNRGNVQVAIVFAAFVPGDGEVALSAEHQAFEWLSLEEAAGRLAWPREREALRHVEILLGSGDAGAVEDVLRIPD